MLACPCRRPLTNPPSHPSPITTSIYHRDHHHPARTAVKPNATKEEITQLMDGKSGPVFAQQIRMTGQKLEAKRALQEIQDRHQDVLRIEKSILVWLLNDACACMCLRVRVID